jgi:hypothetical protein
MEATMIAKTLAPGIYRDEDSRVFLVDECHTAWLVDHADGPDHELPRAAPSLTTDDVAPFPCVEPEDATEYRRVVQEARAAEASRTWRDMPPLL